MAQQILSPSANYTLGNADDGKLVLLNGGATLSGPAESPMPPATGFYVDIRNVLDGVDLVTARRGRRWNVRVRNCCGSGSTTGGTPLQVGGSDATFAPQGAGATVEGASSLTVAAGGCRR